MCALKKNQFSIEEIEMFTGYYNPERDWNGWDCPYFEWEEALRIVEWINNVREQVQLKADTERKVIIDVEDPEGPFEISGQNMSTEDGERVLYEVGTGWWIWEATDKYKG